jgi:hypothetical protein
MFDLRMNAYLLRPELPRIVGGTLIAGAALISAVAGGLALTARSELKSLRFDVAATHDELALARERTTALEQRLAAALQKVEQQAAVAGRQIQSDQVTEKRGDRPAFSLTPDETQLVRSYIKAPLSSDMAGTIGVGQDLHNTALLPLPAQIVGKAPRLGGGRFTVDRNGAIVISLRNSQMADAVIQPNKRLGAGPQ